MPDAAQIIEPEKPESASARPDAQKASIGGEVLEQEFIERQQQADLQRDPAFRRLRCANKGSSLPHHQTRAARLVGMVSMLAYSHPLSNIHIEQCWRRSSGGYVVGFLE
jgi:hypothetical protein